MSARERFLTLVLDRLTGSATIDSDEGTPDMLREMAQLLDTAGAYVIMLARDRAGSVAVELRQAWYERPVEPMSFDDSRLPDLDQIFRNGPLIINDARRLPASQARVADELERRGLRAALMHGVYVHDELRGFVGFNDDKAREWGGDELRLADQLAQSIVFTLDKQLSDRALVQAEERIRSFITETPIPVYCWEFDPPISCELSVDEQLAALDRGVLVECNQAFADDFGLDDVASALGRTYADVSSINPGGFAEQLTHFIVNDYLSVDHRTEVHAGDRTYFYVSNATGFVEDAHLYRIWGNVRNVTDLEDAEREVAAQRARVAMAIEAGGLGFFEWDVETGRGIIDLPGEMLGGRTTQELTFADVRGLIGEDNVARVLEALRDYQEGSADRFTVDLEVEDESGGRRHALLQGRPSPSDDGRSRKFTGVMQDISKIRESEAARAQLEEQVRTAQRLESLGLLAGGIAHDFNNLLTAILGNADLVERELPVDSEHRVRLDEIGTAARVASDLCRQMLAYAGKGNLVLGATDVRDLIEGMRSLLESSISRKISLRFDLRPAPLIDADASQIQQVLLNLVINAGEAIGDRPGEITISTGARDCTTDDLAAPHLDHELPAGRYTYVEVLDTGVGMPDEVRARIFDPFFTTKFTGRGLGMSAVLGIVRAHRGSIRIESEPGRGTSSQVLFPVAVAEAATDVGPATSAGPAGRDGATVLCVDDDQFVRSTVAAMLDRLGFEAISAASGLEAVRLFPDHRDEIDCVILDLTMPEMDGIETFAELRELDPDVKVVLVSGYDESEATREFVGHGLAAFMQKPFTMDALDATLRDVLE